MSKEGMKQCEIRKYLPAFADGELDVEQNLRVLEAMAMDPTHTRRVLHQQQLRKACARVMDRPDCCCPNELRDKLQTLAAADTPALSLTDTPDDQTLRPQGGLGVGVDRAPSHTDAEDHAPGGDEGSGPAVLARIGQWVPAAVAAVLLIGAMVAFFAPTREGTPMFGVSEARLAAFTGRHKVCATDIDQLHPGIESPTNIAQLPGTIDDYFGDHAGTIDTALDLSVLGYEFQRVGVCGLPGKNAVHIVYKAAEGASHDRALSVWIKPDDQNLELTPGRVYSAEFDGGRPLIIFKRLGRVYYLVADMPDDARRAADMLAHPNESPANDDTP